MGSHRFNGIREQDPLKQGLKLNYAAAVHEIPMIREQDPLKQGLKQNSEEFVESFSSYSRARSIKTRIETILICFVIFINPGFASKIH